MAKKIYFNNLDSIRFFAALAIFFCHGFQAWVGNFSGKRPDEIPQVVQNFSHNMGLGVELFFLISGFLITYILLKEKEKAGKIHIGKFLMRRAIRIWPLYFLLIAITPALILWLGENSPSYIPNLFFYGNFDVIINGRTEFPFSHFWSIAIEEQFYLVWPFIIAFIPRKKLIYVFVLIILISIFSRYYFYNLPQKNYANFYYNTLCRMDTLTIGAIVGLYYDKCCHLFRSKQWLFIGALVLLVYLLFFTVSNSWFTLTEALFRKYIYIIPILMITLYLITKEKKERTFKLWNFTSYLGKASYGLYMIHNMLILVVIHKLMFNNGLRDGWLFWLIYAVITTVLVIISYELYEKPILKLKRYFTVIKTGKD